MKSGESGTKRRKIVCFEQMLFLMPQTQERATSSICSSKTGRNGEEDTDKKESLNKVQVMVHPKLLCVESNSAKVIPREK